MRTIPYPHPGEILIKEFLKPMGITNYLLAKVTGIPATHVGEIAAGRRSITADTGLRLAKFFGNTEGFWTGLQDDYDRAMLKDKLVDELAKITPWQRDAT